MAPRPADAGSGGTSLAHRELTMAMAVVRYLKDNHHYSLEVKPGPGDPVADFLVNKRDAHCQFFASASVLLLRCMGIPARYVGGYYCHENDGTNKMVVRLRDAHAWTEIWLDGVGWMTLDATPGSGRPDQANPPISPWRRIWEWIQDTAKAVASWIGSLRWPHFVFTFGMIPCVAACVSLVRRLRQRGPKLKATRYAYPNDDLERIATAFEKLLRRRRIACPPNRTWQEHVAGLTRAESKAVDPEGLRAFLKQYNAVRFGDSRDARRLAELRETMERL